MTPKNIYSYRIQDNFGAVYPRKQEQEWQRSIGSMGNYFWVVFSPWTVCTIGWRDLVLFRILKRTHGCRSGIFFYEFNSKKSAISAAHAAKFHFQKITWTLKINFFANSLKIKIWLIFFLFYKNEQNGSWSVQGKNNIFFSLSSVFASKQAKEQF